MPEDELPPPPMDIPDAKDELPPPPPSEPELDDELPPPPSEPELDDELPPPPSEPELDDDELPPPPSEPELDDELPPPPSEPELDDDELLPPPEDSPKKKSSSGLLWLIVLLGVAGYNGLNIWQTMQEQNRNKEQVQQNTEAIAKASENTEKNLHRIKEVRTFSPMVTRQEQLISGYEAGMRESRKIMERYNSSNNLQQLRSSVEELQTRNNELQAQKQQLEELLKLYRS